MMLQTKSYDVAIQMKAVLTHGAICFSKFHNMKFGNLVEICFRLNLTVKGLMAYIPNWEAPPERGTFFRLGL